MSKINANYYRRKCHTNSYKMIISHKFPFLFNSCYPPGTISEDIYRRHDAEMTSDSDFQLMLHKGCFRGGGGVDAIF